MYEAGCRRADSRVPASGSLRCWESWCRVRRSHDGRGPAAADPPGPPGPTGPSGPSGPEPGHSPHKVEYPTVETAHGRGHDLHARPVKRRAKARSATAAASTASVSRPAAEGLPRRSGARSGAPRRRCRRLRHLSGDSPGMAPAAPGAVQRARHQRRDVVGCHDAVLRRCRVGATSCPAQQRARRRTRTAARSPASGSTPPRPPDQGDRPSDRRRSTQRRRALRQHDRVGRTATRSTSSCRRRGPIPAGSTPRPATSARGTTTTATRPSTVARSRPPTATSRSRTCRTSPTWARAAARTTSTRGCRRHARRRHDRRGPRVRRDDHRPEPRAAAGPTPPATRTPTSARGSAAAGPAARRTSTFATGLLRDAVHVLERQQLVPDRTRHRRRRSNDFSMTASPGSVSAVQGSVGADDGRDRGDERARADRELLVGGAPRV